MMHVYYALKRSGRNEGDFLLINRQIGWRLIVLTAQKTHTQLQAYVCFCSLFD